MTKGIAVKCLACGGFMIPQGAPITFPFEDFSIEWQFWECLKCRKIVYTARKIK